MQACRVAFLRTGHGPAPVWVATTTTVVATGVSTPFLRQQSRSLPTSRAATSRSRPFPPAAHTSRSDARAADSTQPEPVPLVQPPAPLVHAIAQPRHQRAHSNGLTHRGGGNNAKHNGGSFFNGLTAQLNDLDASLVPTAEQHERKMWLESTLKPLVERHTGGILHTFGSCENGFWMNGSDVDACLVVRRCTQRQAWITKLRLVDCLVRREGVGVAQVVKAARVPVAKLQDACGVELCDVSVNNVAALENSRFVQALAHLDPRVRPLGRFIKHWASRRRINNRSEGTLSTYTLILQLFYFLQTREPPVLPLVVNLLLHNSTPGECDSEVPTAAKAVNTLFPGPDMSESSGELRPLPFVTESADILGEGDSARFVGHGRNREQIGELLHGFFQFWGDEAFRGGDEGRGQSVFVFDGSREENDLGVLVVRCPLTGKNVNPFTISVWQAIHAEFVRAASLLRQGWSLDALCEAAEEPPIGCGTLRAAFPPVAGVNNPQPPPGPPPPPPPMTKSS